MCPSTLTDVLPCFHYFVYYFHWPTEFLITLHVHYRGDALPAEIVQFRPDTILAAECVYFEPAFPLLLQTLRDLLALCPSATVYFCFKKRRRADLQFMKSLRKVFDVVEVADDERPVFSRKGLFLFTIRSKTRTQKSTVAVAAAQEAVRPSAV